MPARLVFLVALLLMTVLCIGPDRGHTQEATPGTPMPTVHASVRNVGPLPAGCEPEEVVAFLTAFLEAFNRGDARALPGFFPEKGVYPYADQRGFQWYSVTDLEGHFVTYDPAELPAYFAARHEQHERLKLIRMEVGTGPPPSVGIVYRLSREADDLPLREMTGKGAIYCDDHTIFVWSMAQDVPDPSLRATPEQ